MGRKSTHQERISPSPETNNINTNDLYRKRLRSWKQKPTHMKSNRPSISSSIMNNEDLPTTKSTIYTYPINLNHTNRNSLSNTILSESLTTESAFYCRSISNTSIQTIDNLNNNNVTTVNVKRKTSASSCESQLSQVKSFEILPNPNISTKPSITNNLQLTYHQNPTKRSRFSTNDSIVTNHRSPALIDDGTIDINQLDPPEPLSSTINNESLVNCSNSMETAVKMIQPIVDIIFNAFEDQLKNVQSSSSNCSSTSPLANFLPRQFYPSMTIPYFSSTPPTRPLVLHAVNFNVQLTTKNPIEKQLLTNVTINENNPLQSISLTELKQKVISYILSKNLITDHHTNDGNQRNRRKLKRIAQLAVIGVSVLCGYLLL